MPSFGAVTHSRSDIAALLRRHGLDPRRSLGQNFVADPDTVRRIASLSAAGPHRPVLEIGAGLGSLTLALAETGAAVTAVETDPKLAAALRQVLREHDSGQGVEVVEADATACDWDELLAGRVDWQLVANLPYRVAASLIVDLLRGVPQIRSMLVMVQLEVAQRLAAQPGDARIGIPSLLIAYHADAEIVARVPPSVFVPAPRVDSALLSIERRAAPLRADAAGKVGLKDIEPLLRAAFGQRRKMLRRSLAKLLDSDDFADACVDAGRRPQTLALSEWAALAAARRR